jgi:phage tail sheath protein FI
MDLPPSGVVAGVMSRNDDLYGVWNAPAGPTGGAVLGVTGLTYTVSSADQSLLNPESVNAIRDFGASGILLFGARTLATNPTYRFVSTRRFATNVAESIREGTGYAPSQPNDATLWAQLEADATAYLTSLYSAGAFPGTTAADAFFVRCDGTTMTALDIAEGRTVLLVGIAPEVPTEFIVLRIEYERSTPAPVPGIAAPGLFVLVLLCGGLATRSRALRGRVSGA